MFNESNGVVNVTVDVTIGKQANQVQWHIMDHAVLDELAKHGTLEKPSGADQVFDQRWALLLDLACAHRHVPNLGPAQVVLVRKAHIRAMRPELGVGAAFTKLFHYRQTGVMDCISQVFRSDSPTIQYYVY